MSVAKGEIYFTPCPWGLCWTFPFSYLFHALEFLCNTVLALFKSVVQ